MLGQENGRKLVESAIQKAVSLGISGSVAVVDAGGNLLAFARMDRSLMGSIDSAIRKANTSVNTGLSTGDWFEMFTGGNKIFGEVVAHGSQGMLFLAGGEPLFDSDEQLIGGIGFGGGSPDQDAEVVRSALTKFKSS